MSPPLTMTIPSYTPWYLSIHPHNKKGAVFYCTQWYLFASVLQLQPFSPNFSNFGPLLMILHCFNRWILWFFGRVLILDDCKSLTLAQGSNFDCVWNLWWVADSKFVFACLLNQVFFILGHRCGGITGFSLLLSLRSCTKHLNHFFCIGRRKYVWSAADGLFSSAVAAPKSISHPKYEELRLPMRVDLFVAYP